MDIIKTSIGLTKTIKNVGRFKEIVYVFSKHGFNGMLIKAGLSHFLPGDSTTKDQLVAQQSLPSQGDPWWQELGTRLRKSFEELGPSFIKLGQLMSSREDIFDAALIHELKLLQNKVKPIPFSEVRFILEDALKEPLDTIFREISQDPIGTASIGSVYKGVLINDEEVVIKIRRPGITKSIQTDFEILNFILTKLESSSEEIKFLGLSKMVQDFFKTTQKELNFLIEAQNAKRLSENLKKIDSEGFLVIPRVYDEYSNQDVLVLEFLNGKPFNEFGSVEELDKEVRKRIIESVNMFTHTLLADGFFHADLHGGNFFVLADKRIGIIDFGLMGTLSTKNRTNLIAILYSLISHDFDNLVYEFLEVAEYEGIPNHQELVRDIEDALSPYIGLSVQQTNMNELSMALVRTLSRHRLYLPRNWYIIFRALMTLDGVGRSIGLDLNIFNILKQEIPSLVSKALSKNKLQEELVWAGKDIVTSLRIIPKHLKWFLRESSKKDYAFQFSLKELEKTGISISRAIKFLGSCFLSGILFLSGVLLLQGQTIQHMRDIPTLTLIFWFFALAIMLNPTIYKD